MQFMKLVDLKMLLSLDLVKILKMKYYKPNKENKQKQFNKYQIKEKKHKKNWMQKRNYHLNKISKY